MPPATHYHLSSKRDRSTREKDRDSNLSEEKYRKIKRKLKEVLEENDKVVDQLDKSKKQILRLRRERNLLLERIAKLEDSDSSNISSLSSTSSDSEGPDDNLTRLSSAKRKFDKDTKSARQINSSKRSAPTTPVAPAPVKKRRKKRSEMKPRRVQQLDKDEKGNYVLPVQIGILTVINLGKVEWERDTFHNDRYIWPIGYTVRRTYSSMVDPDKQTTYVCSISDGGDEDQNNPIIANTATGAWTTVVKVANAIRKRDHSNSASGPDYYGFSHPTIAKMIQDLPNTDKCKNYVWQEFIVMQGRGPANRPRSLPATPVPSKKEEARPEAEQYDEEDPVEEFDEDSDTPNLGSFGEQPKIRATHGGKKPLSSLIGRDSSPISSGDELEVDEGSESDLVSD
ncbi:hypothetical protein K493DRAFT_344176 [Basidiobolus meristosporus CBS 931.73]|uniref:INO80 complex subunit E N-terminal domain-containing protein n=1 Tax=Basidiobolus meristosporus CBS 931.73 TaxID=1314790 RepID=A0A1Y1ZA87_9FUNG|nr:hypothetical protein K493DRAFT_344176 [Basidiobolus meristosporus CBS 931.73]|eukprot:ORY07076.1 hypothetical protein K493DRAFT_344176 [Basidiobolus meristosporus CBS 931.73]